MSAPVLGWHVTATLHPRPLYRQPTTHWLRVGRADIPVEVEGFELARYSLEEEFRRLIRAWLLDAKPQDEERVRALVYGAIDALWIRLDPKRIDEIKASVQVWRLEGPARG